MTITRSHTSNPLHILIFNGDKANDERLIPFLAHIHRTQLSVACIYASPLTEPHWQHLLTRTNWQVRRVSHPVSLKAGCIYTALPDHLIAWHSDQLFAQIPNDDPLPPFALFQRLCQQTNSHIHWVTFGEKATSPVPESQLTQLEGFSWHFPLTANTSPDFRMLLSRLAVKPTGRAPKHSPHSGPQATPSQLTQSLPLTEWQALQERFFSAGPVPAHVLVDARQYRICHTSGDLSLILPTPDIGGGIPLFQNLHPLFTEPLRRICSEARHQGRMIMAAPINLSHAYALIRMWAHPYHASSGEDYLLVAFDVWEMESQPKFPIPGVSLPENHPILQTLLQSSNVGLFAVDGDGYFLYVNDAFAQLMGYSPSALIGTHFVKLILQQHRPAILREFQANAKDGEVIHGEYTLLCKDGSVTVVEVTGRWLTDNQGTLIKIVTCLHIKPHKTSQSLLQETARLTQMGAWELELNTHTLKVTETICQLLSIPTTPTLPWATFLQLWLPEAREQIIQTLAHTLESGQPFDLTLPHKNVHGQSIRLRLTGKPIHTLQTTVQVLGTLQDVTQPYLNLIRSRHLGIISDHTPNAVLVTDSGGRILIANKQYEKWQGQTESNLIGSIPAWWKSAVAENETSFKALRGFKRETHFHSAEDGLIWAQQNFTPVEQEPGTSLQEAWVVIISDISSLKSREDALQSIKDNLHSLINSTTDLIWAIDRDYKLTILNRAARLLFGKIFQITVHEGGVALPEGLPSELIAWGRNLFQRAFRGEAFTERYTYNLDAHEYTIEIHFNPVWDNHGQITGVGCFGRDITSRRLRTRQLREAYISLDRTAEGFCSLDHDGLLTYANKSALSMWACNWPEIRRRPLSAAFKETWTQPELKPLRKALKAQTDTEITYYIPAQHKWFRAWLYPDNSGMTMRFEDITQERITHRRLMESEQLYRSIAENFPNGSVSILDRQFRMVFAAGQGFSNHKVSPSDYLGRNYLETISEEVRPMVEAKMKSVLAGNSETYHLSFRDTYYSVSAQPIRKVDGTTDKILLATQNTTEARRATERISHQMRILKGVLESADYATAVLDEAGRLQMCNQLFQEIMLRFTGMRINLFMPLTSFTQTLPEGEKLLSALNQLTYEGVNTLSIKLPHPLTGPAYLHLTASPITSADQKNLGRAIFIQDRTERYRLKEAQTRIWEHSSDLIAILNEKGRIEALNPAATRLLASNGKIPIHTHIAHYLPPALRASLASHAHTLAAGATLRNVAYEYQTDDPAKPSKWFSVNAVATPQFSQIYIVARDITEQRQTEALIRESEANLSALINNTHDLVLSVDRAYRLITCNDAYRDLIKRRYGVSVQKGQSTLNSLPPNRAERWKNLFDRAMEGDRVEEEFTDEIDGKKVYHSLSLSPIFHDREVIGCTLFSRDITHRIEVEQQLREQGAYQHAMLEASDHAFLLLDLNANLLAANEYVKKRITVSSGTVKGMNATNLLPLSLKEKVSFLGQIETVWQGHVDEGIYQWAWGGKPLWWKYRFAPVYDAEGEIVAVSLSGQDITHIKETEFKLRKLNSRFLMAAQSAQIGVWEWNLQDKCLIWDDITRSLYQLAPQKTPVTIAEWQQYILPEDLQSHQQALENTLEKGSKFDVTFRIKRESGIRFIHSTARVYYEDNGTPIRLIGIERDVTQQREVEAALFEAKNKAEEMGRLKSYFLANMSHEIRTPLNGLTSIIPILQHEKDLDRIHTMLTVMERSGKRLMQTLTGILELAKIEAEKTPLQLVPLSLTEFLNGRIDYWYPTALQKGVSLSFSSSQKSHYILADERVLEQILDNLIGNALKFTSQGGVTLSIFPPKTKGFVGICVKDTGIGIAAENQKKILDPFSQESEGRNRTFEGTGIGLTIVHRYTKLMGGSLTLHSQKGVGSSFTVWFPNIDMDEPTKA